MISEKQELGQFYTTNYNYILNDIVIPDNITRIIEPFAGEGHLTSYAVSQLKIIENALEYDIDPKSPFITKRDTLLDPPDYTGFYIITNPPYLARNKNSNKEIYDKYNENDLYKCFLRNIIDNTCIGGIIIIPLNFFSSIRKNDTELRKQFMKIYHIDRVRIFEEQVFNDTSYTVCVVQFINHNSNICNSENTKTDIIEEVQLVDVEFYPSKEKKIMEIGSYNLYTFGGHMLSLPQNNIFKIERLTKKNLERANTQLELKCIDDSEKSQLGLYYKDNVDSLFIDETENLSARSYATLIIEPSITCTQQEILSSKFNKFIRENRVKYHSLFLTNYRESKQGFARKRISMNHGYEIVNYLLGSMEIV